MHRTLMLAVLALLIPAGCATPESGIRDPARFRAIAERSTLASTRSPAEIAACFRDAATLLPMSDFIATSPTQTSYRLRGYGFTFEEIEFAATPTGAEITILLAPGLNAKWRRDFARDRLAPLKACAGA